MSQIYNQKLKRSKPQDTQLGILKMYAFCRNSAEGLMSRRERCWCYAVYVLENTPKNVVVQGRAKLEHSSHIVRSVLTLQALTYIGGNNRTGECIWNYAAGTMTYGLCCPIQLLTPMQVVKQPEHRRTSTTE